MKILIIALCLALAGCAGSGGYGNVNASGTADDPRVAMLEKAATLKYASQQTFELQWKVVDLSNGQQMLLPEVKTYQPIQPPDVSMALLELSKDPWPSRIHAVSGGLISAGMAITGFEAVRQIGKMGRAIADSAPSIENNGTMTTSSVGRDGNSTASPVIKTIGGDSVEKVVGGDSAEKIVEPAAEPAEVPAP